MNEWNNSIRFQFIHIYICRRVEVNCFDCRESLASTLCFRCWFSPSRSVCCCCFSRLKNIEKNEKLCEWFSLSCCRRFVFLSFFLPFCVLFWYLLVPHLLTTKNGYSMISETTRVEWTYSIFLVSVFGWLFCYFSLILVRFVSLYSSVLLTAYLSSSPTAGEWLVAEGGDFVAMESNHSRSISVTISSDRSTRPVNFRRHSSGSQSPDKSSLCILSTFSPFSSPFPYSSLMLTMESRYRMDVRSRTCRLVLCSAAVISKKIGRKKGREKNKKNDSANHKNWSNIIFFGGKSRSRCSVAVYYLKMIFLCLLSSCPSYYMFTVNLLNPLIQLLLWCNSLWYVQLNEN